MERSKLHLFRFTNKDNIEHVKKGIHRLLEAMKLESILKEEEIVAIKIHIGEKGNKTHLKPYHVKPIIDYIKNYGAKPFLTDTCVLYKSQRSNAYDHVLLAHEHGFGIEKIGVPFIVADGIAGRNEASIRIDAPINKEVYIAADFLAANSIVVVSHATGHMQTGIGATIKNIGMGMSSRKGKLVQHSVSKPRIVSQVCTACGLCLRWCPADAIVVNSEGKSVIVEEKCIGCGECLAVCRFNAVKFRWDRTDEEVQKQIAEHALGVIKSKRGKIAYITFAITMTKDCDCMAQPERFVVKDIGVIGGYDPIAIDKAIIDLTEKESGINLSKASYPNINYNVQLEYGEKIGLGRRNYEIEEIQV
ncbi:MAG: DUF362 domain-containing protein [Candidatus Marinimicrobia bacterium]|nr:DUF362 domain-containing protein [Candidatus Neomarinimicrobiota bacterium]